MSTTRPKLFRAMTWRELARKPLQALLALAGVALAVAAVTAMDMAQRSAKIALEETLSSFSAGGTHRIVGLGDALDNDDYVALKRRFPLLEMAPVKSIDAKLDEAAIVIYGVDILAEGAFERDVSLGEVGQGVELGRWIMQNSVIVPAVVQDRTVEVRIDNQPARLEVAGTHGGAPELFVVDLATAQRITGERTLSHIDVRIEDSATLQRVLSSLPDDQFLEESGVGDPQAAGADKAFDTNLLALALLTLLVAALLIFGALRFYVLQRRRTLGLLRLLGVDRLRLARWVLIEAAVLAAIGVGLGIVGGLMLGESLLDLLLLTKREVFARSAIGEATVSLPTLLTACATGMGVSMLAAAVPARAAGRAEPLSLLEDHSGLEAEQSALTIAIATLAMLAGLALVNTSGGLIQSFAGLFALALGYGFVLAGAVTWLADFARRRFSLAAIWQYPLAVLPRTLSRSQVAIVALIVCVATIIGVGSMIASFERSVTQWVEESFAADVYVGARYELPSAVTERLEAIAGVEEVVAYHRGRARYRQSAISVQSFPRGARSWNEFRLLEGSLPEADGVVAGEPLARQFGWSVGDVIEIGGAQLRLDGIVRDYRAVAATLFIPEGAIDLGFAFHGVAVYASSDVVPTVLAALEEMEVDAIAAEDIRTATLEIFGRTFAVTNILQWLVAVVAALGVLGSLLALEFDRGRELELLRTLGVSRTGRRAFLLGEASALGLIASLAAIPLGAALCWILVDVVNVQSFGWTMPFALPFDVSMGAVAVGMIAAAVAGAIAALSR